MNYLDIPAVHGVLTVTHVKSGCIYMVCSINVRDAAILVNGQCLLGTYQNPKLQELYNDDPTLDYTFIETSSKEESRKYRQDIQAGYYGTDKCLNMQDARALLGVYAFTHVKSGKTIIGMTSDIAKQKRYQLSLLNSGNHKNPTFQELYTNDKELTFSFGVTSDTIEQKSVYERWVKDAIQKGAYVTARKGKGDETVDSVGRKSGMYVISFPNTGLFYVGHSNRVKRRISAHKSFLKHGTHGNKPLQAAYGIDPVYNIRVIYTDSVEEAQVLEQEYLDANKYNPLKLNIATDGSAPCANLHDNPIWHKRIVDAATRTSQDPAVRESKRNKMKAWHAENKGNRDGANNPFAKPISMFGVIYGSVMDAIRTKILPDSVIRKRLKDPEDLEIVYCDRLT